MGRAAGKSPCCGGVLGQRTLLERLSESPSLEEALVRDVSALESTSLGPKRMQSSMYHNCLRLGMDWSSIVTWDTARQKSKGPSGSPCWTPLEDEIMDDWRSRLEGLL